MSFISACCNTPPVEATYTPTGETASTGGMDYYIVGKKGSAQGVVLCYDIFGFHPNTYQVADKISSAGLRVIAPDFFRGAPLTMADLQDAERLDAFKAGRGKWAQNRESFEAAAGVLRAEGVTRLGAVGFCWGAKIALCALGSDCGIKSAALIHPSMLEPIDFEQAQGPVLLLTSGEDPELNEEFAVAKAKPFGELSYRERFADRIHGFCTARSDYTDPDTARDVNRVVRLTAGFFSKTLAD
ncbi:hypothetical protein GGF46_001153 [Coemansia sp. RSA 552]|nr:hypothetical protein GGF46_001153 [Coemansia sp. RSA 552]